MTRRALGLIRRMIAAIVVFVLALEIPHLWHREPGLQPPHMTTDLEHTHREGFVVLEERGPRAEQAPPPSVVPSPAAWSQFSFYPRIRGHRWHPSYYSTPQDDTAPIWYAAEQAKKASTAA